jgi:hypothetical protein
MLEYRLLEPIAQADIFPGEPQHQTVAKITPDQTKYK